MELTSPPTAPLSTAPPTAPAEIPPPTSTWPIVCGVIGILVALAEAAFATVWGIGMPIFLFTKERTTRIRNQPAQDAVHATVEFINCGLMLLLSMVLFIASIQLIRRRKSGVRMASIWGLARMVLAAVYTAGALLAATFASASRMGGVDEGEFMGALLTLYIAVAADRRVPDHAAALARPRKGRPGDGSVEVAAAGGRCALQVLRLPPVDDPLAHLPRVRVALRAI